MQSFISKKTKDVSLTLLKLAISASLIIYVFRDTDFKSLLAQILQISPIVLLSYLALSFFLIVLVSYRWSTLVLEKPTPSDILLFFIASLSALFYNLFLPTAYGGDLVKWTHLGALKIEKSKLIFSVFADRIIGLMGLVTVGFFASLIAQLWGLATVPESVFWLFSILFTGLVIVQVIIFTAVRFSQIPILNKFSIFSKLENYLATRRKVFLKTYLLSVVIQILSFTALYILAVEAQVALPFIYFLILSPVVSLISALPISLAGFGTTEAAYVYFFTQLNATKESVLLLLALVAIFKILLGMIGWITELMITSKRLSRVTIKQ